MVRFKLAGAKVCKRGEGDLLSQVILDAGTDICGGYGN